jgi:tetratricopeptide repeat protein/photosynthetic reaction center cytochrome c subunit
MRLRKGCRMGWIALALPLTALPAAAQIPDKFENLQVLPKDIGKRELIDTMRSFSGALGVRCVHCHMGPPGGGFEGMDFKSDDLEPKRVARVMLRMVRSINDDQLSKIGRSPVLRVDCATCHRGLVRPERIDGVVAQELKEKGADAAVARYRALREEHYGDGSYDFSDRPLNQLGERLIAEQNAAGAVAILSLNTELNKESASSHFLLGEAYRAAGDTEKARASYERSLELAPDNPRAKKRLEELEPKPEASP